jgi:hypothetical protein
MKSEFAEEEGNFDAKALAALKRKRSAEGAAEEDHSLHAYQIFSEDGPTPEQMDKINNVREQFNLRWINAGGGRED